MRVLKLKKKPKTDEKHTDLLIKSRRVEEFCGSARGKCIGKGILINVYFCLYELTHHVNMKIG